MKKLLFLIFLLLGSFCTYATDELMDETTANIVVNKFNSWLLNIYEEIIDPILALDKDSLRDDELNGWKKKLNQNDIETCSQNLLEEFRQLKIKNQYKDDDRENINIPKDLMEKIGYMQLATLAPSLITFFAVSLLCGGSPAFCVIPFDRVYCTLDRCWIMGLIFFAGTHVFTFFLSLAIFSSCYYDYYKKNKNKNKNEIELIDVKLHPKDLILKNKSYSKEMWQYVEKITKYITTGNKKFLKKLEPLSLNAAKESRKKFRKFQRKLIEVNNKINGAV